MHERSSSAGCTGTPSSVTELDAVVSFLERHGLPHAPHVGATYRRFVPLAGSDRDRTVLGGAT